MKRSLKFGAIFLIFSHILLFADAFITYDFSGGRFGDNVLAYLHAKWISYKYKIPLIYRPFAYSDQLNMHLNEKVANIDSFRKHYLSKQDPEPNINSNSLYIVPYFSEVEFEHKLRWNKNWLYFKVDWANPEFKKIIQSLVSPINQKLLDVPLPQDAITVAVHVRKGGGFDNALLADNQNPNQLLTEYSDYYAPLKFPPEYFYTDQLKKISEIFKHAKLYVFVFTDDQNPRGLVERFKNNLIGFDNIEFAYRQSGNHHAANVLEDFFAMTKFDCLIHPQSNYSIVAAKIANYKVEIYPTEHHWENTKSIIDTVEVVINF